MKDKILKKIMAIIAGAGVPGLIFWAACESAVVGGATGATVITIALKTISEKCHIPYEFVIPLLVIIAVISISITDELCDACFNAAKLGMLSKGKTEDQIIEEINNCKIPANLKECIINKFQL